MGEPTVIVRNKSGVLQVCGDWVVPAHGETRIPLEALDVFRPYVEVVKRPENLTLHLYRSPCRPGCGHSLCLLSRAMQREISAMGFDFVWQPWRLELDQPRIGDSRFCSAGSWEGPPGRFAWLHYDNDRPPRQHLAYFREHFAGNICVSKSIVEQLKRAGIEEERLPYVPNGIDTALYRMDGPVDPLGRDSFLFLITGAMSPRKGVDVALQAYGKAFEKGEKVLLVVRNYSYGRDPWAKETIAEFRRSFPDGPPVEYIYETWEQNRMAAVYRRVARHGAYLAPSRVEGFGLTGLEALACGCRLGTTGWSGMLDYATPENSTLFGYKLRRSENNTALYEKGERPMWAEPNVEEVAAWMRSVFATPVNAAKQGEISTDIRRRFTYRRMAEALVQTMKLGGSVVGAVATPEVSASSAPAAERGERIRIRTDETLGIGIPTRDRIAYLAAVLGALYMQTKRPNAVCIVNDGKRNPWDDPAIRALLQRFQADGIRAEVVKGTGRGASPNHNIAMRRLNTDLVLRLDDDLIPASPDFLERLYMLIAGRADIGAVGGVYPVILESRSHLWEREKKKPGLSNELDALLRGQAKLQFQRYEDEHVVECEHLYSSWIYRRAYLDKLGGFFEGYSRFGQREETDASVRLKLLGGWKLLVDTQAVAWHFLAREGGRRPDASREALLGDEKIFRDRLEGWKRKP